MKRTEAHTFGKYFCGNEISAYGRKNGRVDYATLAKSFDAVLANEIINGTGWENWEQENGFIDNSEEIEELEDRIEELSEELDNLQNTFDELNTFGANDEKTAEQLRDLKSQIEELESKIEELEDEKTELEEEQDDPGEIFQYFIISGQGAEILEEYTNEIVFYNNDLDLYVWGVTHWGTRWDYVLTEIPCEVDETANA